MKRLLIGITAAMTLGVPSAASGATVTSSTNAGAVYSARSGEINRLRVDRVTFTGPFGTPLTEFSAPVKIGVGCLAGTPVMCAGTGRVTAHLGDRDDVASVVPFFAYALVFAGDGDDDVFADGSSTSVDGGSGNDILRVNANGGASADGGQGDDRIAGGSEGGDAFDGGPGDDLIVGSSPFQSQVRGQEGDDVLVRRGSPRYGGGTVAGNDGADVITFLDPASPGGAAFDGGRDDDIISGPAVAVDGGPGDDLIEVVGAVGDEFGGATGSTVSCGKGTDTVWADAADTVAADCERVIRSDMAPELPGVADARADAQLLLAHRAQPDPSAG
jgi:hypothetical protein